MRLSKPVDIQEISQALQKDACPICMLLKNLQATALRNVTSAEVVGLCNFHAWALAAAVDLARVAEVFLKLLDSADPAHPVTCSICARIREEEEQRLKELVDKMLGNNLRNWLVEQGSICLPHSEKLLRVAPVKLRPSIEKLIARRRADLSKELEEVRDQARLGEHRGGGVLGHAAEFLVSQRGVRTREEDKC
jgi:Mn-dependent DtxR family transcriptional regulator